MKKSDKIKNNDLGARFWRAFVFVFFDILIIAFSYFFALMVRFDFKYSAIDSIYILGYIETIIPFILCTLLVFSLFRLYQSIWRFASVSELSRIMVAWVVLQCLFVIIGRAMTIRMPISYYLVGFVMSFLFTAGIRFSYRFLRAVSRLLLQKEKSYGDERIMIIGAGMAGRTLVHEILMTDRMRAKVCCVIDDNPSKHRRYIDGVQIVGNRYDIPKVVKEYNITKILFAIPTASGKDKKEILDICQYTDCEVQVMPGIYQIADGNVSVSQLRSVQIEDLLGRDEVVVDNDEIHSFIEGKVVMVTGGGGSIGSELCRQIAKENPKLLIIFDIYENNAYDIQQELIRTCPECNIETLIGSVRNTNRINFVLEKYRPEIIYHAAAHKHVPLMETSPNEVIKNNVFGTYKMAKAASEYGVKRFVLISTDKAVNPTNIMGASKRLCEMVVQMMNRRSKTEFVAVRFGNVLGSNGSVIPLFKKQIEEGGPVTVTDPRIIRYFMTIPEAVALVIQAGIYANGGEIFVLDMGEPVKIDDMARKLIRLSGYEPDVDIPVVYTGLRPGEKLYEEMLMSEEGLKETPNKLIHIGEPIKMNDEE
ncbi:MAG: polysaccharide biosynthesis protein, partial [Lachnospiraceae bacterium]|nr:polysaccharide biosynthesis protein [Lachnospiraceae bacterium]